MKKISVCSTNSLLLSLAIVLITGCSKKDEVDVKFPITAIAKKLDTSSPIRLFDKNGEIKDQAAIAEFTKGSQTFESQEGNSYYNGKIIFLSNTEMQIGDSSPDNVKYAVEVLSNDRIQYTIEDVIPTDDALPTGDIYMINGTATLSALPYGQGKKVLYRRLLYGSFTSFKFPMLRYLKTTNLSSGNDAVSTSRSEGTAFGEFNEEYINTLQDGQTLAIQQVYGSFEKK